MECTLTIFMTEIVSQFIKILKRLIANEKHAKRRNTKDRASSWLWQRRKETFCEPMISISIQKRCACLTVTSKAGEGEIAKTPTLNEHRATISNPSFAEHYFRFIGHFVRVYEGIMAPMFDQESFRCSSGPQNHPTPSYTWIIDGW